MDIKDCRVIHVDLVDYVTQRTDPMMLGWHRIIYPYSETEVMKIAHTTIKQNFIECCLWEMYHDDPLGRKWLAPVTGYTQDFRAIIMRKTEPITDAEMPEKVPTFLDDVKSQNWGRMDDKIVCHDYGSLNFQLKTRLRKWRP